MSSSIPEIPRVNLFFRGKMDIGELLNFKPDIAPKRPAPEETKQEDEGEEEGLEDNPNDTYEKRAAKRRKRQKAEHKKREKDRLAALEEEAANLESYK